MRVCSLRRAHALAADGAPQPRDLVPPRPRPGRSHTAMSQGEAEVASLLILDYNADLTVLNKIKKPPVELAPKVTLDALRREGVL